MTNPDEAPRLSYTSMDTYERCPLQYRFRYVDRLFAPPGPALSFGTTLHAVLDWFHSDENPDPPELPAVLARLDREWVAEGYAGPAEEARYRKQAVQALTAYHRRNLQGFRRPASREIFFELDLDDLVLTGRIDRIDKLEDGTHEIIDYKTNRKLPRLESLAADLQLPIYQFAAEREFGIRASRLTFYYLLPDQRYSTRPWDAERLSAMVERLRGVARAVRAGEFEPTPNRLCPWCDFKEQCPCPPPGEAERGLQKLVDRYADLELRRRALQEMMDLLAGELEEAWPEGEECCRSRRNTLRRQRGGDGPRFSLEG